RNSRRPNCPSAWRNCTNTSASETRRVPAPPPYRYGDITMKLNKLTLACSAALVTAFGLAAPAQAQYSGDVIRIGFITDMSGLYSDIDGPAGTTAIQMAIDDMGGAINGKKIELLSADHQNKADIAAAKSREWFDTQGMDMLLGGTTS